MPPELHRERSGELGLVRRESRVRIQLGKFGMLSRIMRWLAPISFSAAVGLMLIACGNAPATQDGGPSSPSPAPTGTGDSLTAIGAASTPPLWYATSLRTMVEEYNTIIVGRVDGVADVRYEVKLHPNGYRVEQPPLTVSTVSVLRVISAPRVKEGQTISFQQAGGPTKDGSSIVVVGDRLVEVGQTYFMFLNDLSFLFGVDEFSGPPFGRFVVGSD